MSPVPTVKLNNGVKMPVLGLGTYLANPNEVLNAVKYAIDADYRHIDTAFFYGNEHEIGEAIKVKIAEGVIKREDIFLTTKLWCHHHDPSKVEYACRKSLENLGLDYVDLYLMHFPGGFIYIDDQTLLPKKSGTDEVMLSDVDYLDTWKAMESLVKKGLVKSIGISNFNSEQTDRLLKNCEIKPVVNQVECNIDINQKKLIEFSKQRGIVITAYCPLGRPNPAEKKPKFLFDDRTKTIAAKYNKTAAQVAIKYTVQIGAVTIPKSVTNSRIDENMNMFDFELSAEDMKVLDSMETGNRVAKFPFAQNHQYYPFNIEF